MISQATRATTACRLRSVVSLLALSVHTSRSISAALTMTSTSSVNWSQRKSEALEKCFLPLSSDHHKGSSGRIGVLGGSAQYTGAPYYAGMAALQTGADLAYVFCAQEAALAIKSYSPELMVAPVYVTHDHDTALGQGSQNEADKLVETMVGKVVPFLERLHVLVIGPGLGRCPLVFRASARIIKSAMELDLWIVLDADALFMLTLDEYNGMLGEYDKVILTPNQVEYQRLSNAVHADLSLITKGLIVRKGAHDVITDLGRCGTLVCTETGGLKRSGGLGDILSGSIATFTAWNTILKSRGCTVDQQLSCWAACCVAKKATHHAFQVRRRAMTAPDVLSSIGHVMTEMESNDK